MNGSLGNLKFLVVDDNAFMRAIVIRVLKALGAGTVKTATNGEQAIKMISSEKPDLMICDWHMDPVNGLELIRHVRLDEESPDPFLPIILMTGFADRGHVFSARDAGVTEFLVKPLSARALWSRIEAIIDRPRPYVRLSTYFGPDRRRKALSFDGDDRRGQGGPRPKQDGDADNKPQDMDQKDINYLFNPDEKVLDQMTDEERAAAIKKMNEETAGQ